MTVDRLFAKAAVAAAVVGVVCWGGAASTSASGAGGPFRWLEPEVTLTSADLRGLDWGGVVKTLPSRKGELAVFTATRLNASPDVFVEWTRRIEALKRGPAIPAVGRFSDPPKLDDLDGLVLDRRDLDAIRQCRPGDCKVKLSADEIEAFRPVVAEGRDDAIHVAFRRMLLARLNAYRAGGLETAPAPATRSDAPKPSDVFAALVTNSPYIGRSDPRLLAWLENPNDVSRANVESFFYWSKEYYASGKPVVSLIHVGITRQTPGGEGPEVLVAGKNLYSTRYMNGTLTLTALVRDPASGSLYLTYVHRTQLDMLNRFFGGIARAIVQSRIVDGGPELLRILRTRVEGGPPPAADRE
ncbi:MAG: hypothetical protein WC815_11240 [Vicinamibacterales bacterium]|jgi:hypothetical protein